MPAGSGREDQPPDAPRRGARTHHDRRHHRRTQALALWRFLRRVQKRITAHHLNVAAAGVAFYGLLALFPFMAALISVFGLVADPTTVREQLQVIQTAVPDEAYKIIDDQVQELARRGSSLSISLIVSTAIALYSSTRGIKAIMDSLNMVYAEAENRNIIKKNLVALGLTAGGILAMVSALLMIVVLPPTFAFVGLTGDATAEIILAGRWLLMLVGLLLALNILYWIAPNRPKARFRVITWGSVVAAVLWLLASMLFSWYVASFATYNETYGSLGAVVILLMWFFVGAYAVLVGAEIDAELGEHRRESQGEAAADPL